MAGRGILYSGWFLHTKNEILTIKRMFTGALVPTCSPRRCRWFITFFVPRGSLFTCKLLLPQTTSAAVSMTSDSAFIVQLLLITEERICNGPQRRSAPTGSWAHHGLIGRLRATGHTRGVHGRRLLGLTGELLSACHSLRAELACWSFNQFGEEGRISTGSPTWSQRRKSLFVLLLIYILKSRAHYCRLISRSHSRNIFLNIPFIRTLEHTPIS